MTAAELAYKKMCDQFEEKERNIYMKIGVPKEIDLMKCSADGDILTLGFTDGTERHLNVFDCNSEYAEGVVWIVDDTGDELETVYLS